MFHLSRTLINSFEISFKCYIFLVFRNTIVGICVSYLLFSFFVRIILACISLQTISFFSSVSSDCFANFTAQIISSQVLFFKAVTRTLIEERGVY